MNTCSRFNTIEILIILLCVEGIGSKTVAGFSSAWTGFTSVNARPRGAKGLLLNACTIYDMLNLLSQVLLLNGLTFDLMYAQFINVLSQREYPNQLLKKIYVTRNEQMCLSFQKQLESYWIYGLKKPIVDCQVRKGSSDRLRGGGVGGCCVAHV